VELVEDPHAPVLVFLSKIIFIESQCIVFTVFRLRVSVEAQEIVEPIAFDQDQWLILCDFAEYAKSTVKLLRPLYSVSLYKRVRYLALLYYSLHCKFVVFTRDGLLVCIGRKYILLVVEYENVELNITRC